MSFRRGPHVSAEYTGGVARSFRGRAPYFDRFPPDDFPEPRLFDALFGLEALAPDGRAGDYLKRLHLDRKVTVADGKLSTVALSQGQRKRLALLTAYLEDRPVYMFDEWAADQDPIFKEVFYDELLPELAADGKTLLVITHDDAWWDRADRVVKLREGRIVGDERVVPA